MLVRSQDGAAHCLGSLNIYHMFFDKAVQPEFEKRSNHKEMDFLALSDSAHQTGSEGFAGTTFQNNVANLPCVSGAVSLRGSNPAQ